MQMSIQLLTRSVAKYAEEKHLEQKKQLHNFLFPIDDFDDSAEIFIDEYFGDAFAAATITQGDVAPVVLYQPGSQNSYTPELMKRKTPIDESLRDSAVVGLPADSPFKKILQRRVRNIVDGPMGFMPAFKMAKIKMAINLMLTGTLLTYDENGTLKTTVDFGRTAGLTDTYNFTTSGNNMDGALLQAVVALQAQGVDDSALAVMMGSTWLSDYENDSAIIARQAFNRENETVTSNMLPPELQGCQGVRVIGRVRPAGSSVSVLVLTYTPGCSYKAYSGDTASAFLPATKMFMWSMNTPAWNFGRGIDVVNSANKIIRVSGPVVLDSYISAEPVAEFIRASARPFMAVSNIDHTYACTGTFS
jgi:hypothetical protein